jgi:hypothetical protein
LRPKAAAKMQVFSIISKFGAKIVLCEFLGCLLLGLIFSVTFVAGNSRVTLI